MLPREEIQDWKILRRQIIKSKKNIKNKQYLTKSSQQQRRQHNQFTLTIRSSVSSFFLQNLSRYLQLITWNLFNKKPYFTLKLSNSEISTEISSLEFNLFLMTLEAEFQKLEVIMQIFSRLLFSNVDGIRVEKLHVWCELLITHFYEHIVYDKILL